MRRTTHLERPTLDRVSAFFGAQIRAQPASREFMIGADNRTHN